MILYALLAALCLGGVMLIGAVTGRWMNARTIFILGCWAS